MKTLALCLLLLTACLTAFAQGDSSIIRKPVAKTISHEDSMYLAKLNTTGNLMIAGGVGLCGAGSYLLYYGIKTYNTPPAPTSVTPDAQNADIQRNHKQGTIFVAVGGLAIAGGLALTTFGAIKKHEFKLQKRVMSMEAGLSPDGRVLVALHF